MAIFTARLGRAIARLLEGPAEPGRKGDPPRPAVVHAVTVGLILSRYTDDEDVILAGLLLGALDAPPATPEALEAEFGPRVSQMIRDVAEPFRDLPWSTRTARYLRRLASAPNGSLLVAAADAIATLLALIGGRDHPAVAGGRRGGSVGEQLHLARDLYEVVRGSWPRCPLLTELRNRIEEAERRGLSRS